MNQSPFRSAPLALIFTLAALTAAVAGAVLLAADPIGGSTQESVLNITAAVAGLSMLVLTLLEANDWGWTSARTAAATVLPERMSALNVGNASCA